MSTDDHLFDPMDPSTDGADWWSDFLTDPPPPAPLPPHSPPPLPPSPPLTAANAPRLFIVGMGYVGQYVARCVLERGWEVAGSVRTEEEREQLRAEGLNVFWYDLDQDYAGLEEDGLRWLRHATHLLATVPPVAIMDLDPVLSMHKDTILEAAVSDSLVWAGYLSSSSVYGDHGGKWVDEQAPCRTRPGTGASHRLAAERSWLMLRKETGRKLKSHVFRLAAIYGPGRSALETMERAYAASPPHAAADAASATAATPVEAPRGGGGGEEWKRPWDASEGLMGDTLMGDAADETPSAGILGHSDVDEFEAPRYVSNPFSNPFLPYVAPHSSHIPPIYLFASSAPTPFLPYVAPDSSHIPQI